jgi:hypothetical protein
MGHRRCVIRFWLLHARQQKNWEAHQDINDVMLATTLIPDLLLSVGEKRPLVE